MSEDSNVTNNLTNTKNQLISFEELKNDFICTGASEQDLAKKYDLPLSVVRHAVEVNKLQELRSAHIKHGLSKLQNLQIAQADKLMNIESSFKQMRVHQLEKQLEEYAAYFSLHGHLYRVNPITKEILKDINGIAIPIKIPNITREIMDLKESVQLSEGLKNVLAEIDSIINKPKDETELDAIDVTSSSFDSLFSSKKQSPDDE